MAKIIQEIVSCHRCMYVDINYDTDIFFCTKTATNLVDVLTGEIDEDTGSELITLPIPDWCPVKID